MTVSGVGSVGGDSASVSPTAESVELASPTVSVPSVGLLRRGKGSVSVTGSEAAVRVRIRVKVRARVRVRIRVRGKG